MSKGKGKDLSHIPPLPNPSAGSANPSASFAALWGYIHPALEHIMRSSTNDTTRAPSVDVIYHMGIHTATYNYFTAQSDGTNVQAHAIISEKGNGVSGTDLYEHLDRYYAVLARETLLGAPQDESTLIHYLVPCFNRYYAGAQSVNRLLNYVNRHYVKRAVDEDKGWHRVNDILDAVIKTIKENDTRDKISTKLREKKAEELKKWGYDEGDPSSLTRAEACAEAASGLDRVVPLSSLALRRFRIEVIEPLLSVPKAKKAKVKAKTKKTSTSPKGRLARAVKDLIEVQEGNEDERRRLAAELAIALRTVGVRTDHPLRKKLDKFVNSVE